MIYMYFEIAKYGYFHMSLYGLCRQMKEFDILPTKLLYCIVLYLALHACQLFEVSI